MDTATAVSLTVAIMGALIALATYLRNGKKDAKAESQREASRDAEIVKRDTEIMTKLDFLGNDLKDIKADNRRTRDEVAEVRKIAQHASERADAAHRRLDRAGVDAKEQA